jgi:acyl-coenzyme A synthetase/AMP-(fatty) acid ligase
MRLGNTPDFPIAYLGAIAAGLVPVPTAAALTAPEVGKIIAALEPSAILCDPSIACPAYERTVTLDALRGMRDLPAADWHRGDPERLAYIIYTSGTSGRPSAVMHAHRAITARRMMFQGWYGLSDEDRLLHAGAFNWTYTLGTGLMDPWTCGATALIPAPGSVPADLPKLLQEHGATIFAAAPGVYRQMLKHRDSVDLPRLRHGLSAGEKLPDALRKDFRQTYGKEIYEAYGMSECSTFISGSPARPAGPGTLGQPQEGRRVSIRAEGAPAGIGEAGTIAVHHSDPGLMLGYFEDPEATRERFEGDWFLTGDQGVMDENGQITYLGRADDMMNAGGFRVSPLEVEAALLEFEGIEAVGCAEVEVRPDVTLIGAFYTGPKALDDRVLADFASQRLARYKQPRLFIHCDALPANSNGKLQRPALRRYYKEAT